MSHAPYLILPSEWFDGYLISCFYDTCSPCLSHSLGDIECGSVFACDECFAFDNIQSNFRVRIVFHLNDVNNFNSKFSLSIRWSHWSQEYHIQDNFNDAYNWSDIVCERIIEAQDTNVQFQFLETVSDDKKWKWRLEQSMSFDSHGYLLNFSSFIRIVYFEMDGNWIIIIWKCVDKMWFNNEINQLLYCCLK